MGSIDGYVFTTHVPHTYFVVIIKEHARMCLACLILVSLIIAEGL